MTEDPPIGSFRFLREGEVFRASDYVDGVIVAAGRSNHCDWRRVWIPARYPGSHVINVVGSGGHAVRLTEFDQGD